MAMANAEFQQNPFCGSKRDNIYNRQRLDRRERHDEQDRRGATRGGQVDSVLCRLGK